MNAAIESGDKTEPVVLVLNLRQSVLVSLKPTRVKPAHGWPVRKGTKWRPILEWIINFHSCGHSIVYGGSIRNTGIFKWLIGFDHNLSVAAGINVVFCSWGHKFVVHKTKRIRMNRKQSHQVAIRGRYIHTNENSPRLVDSSRQFLWIVFFSGLYFLFVETTRWTHSGRSNKTTTRELR